MFLFLLAQTGEESGGPATPIAEFGGVPFPFAPSGVVTQIVAAAAMLLALYLAPTVGFRLVRKLWARLVGAVDPVANGGHHGLPTAHTPWWRKVARKADAQYASLKAAESRHSYFSKIGRGRGGHKRGGYKRKGAYRSRRGGRR